MASEFLDIPHNMRRIYRRFERWRSAHTGRLPIPERLWTAAVGLAREHGVFRTAKVLRLEYGKLKQLVEGASRAVKRRAAKAPAALRQAPGGERRRSAVPRRARSIAPPAFVELITPRAGSSPECRVELEGPRGRMRIEFKGIATAELVALSRALWDGSASTDQGEV
jgi:hypothetical protein